MGSAVVHSASAVAGALSGLPKGEPSTHCHAQKRPEAAVLHVPAQFGDDKLAARFGVQDVLKRPVQISCVPVMGACANVNSATESIVQSVPPGTSAAHAVMAADCVHDPPVTT